KDLNPVPSLTDFLIYFNSIEEWLNILMENHIKKTNIEYQRLNLNLQSDKYKNRFRLTVSRILKDLVSLGVIGSDLEKELSEIIKYRNALVHGNNLKPSDLMYNKIKSVAEKIERLL
ncbi:HEPN domain-containing protein, partial [Cronobacter sakazakii]